MAVGRPYWLFFTMHNVIFQDPGGVKRNLRIITKKHAPDPEIRFVIKLILKPYGRTTAMPPAWELTRVGFLVKYLIDQKF